MLTVKLLINFDDPILPTFQSLIEKYTNENVEFYYLDTGSKKDIKEALHYFSMYASTQTFIVLEKEGKVIDVIYKESVKDDITWEDLLKEKLELYKNEYQ